MMGMILIGLAVVLLDFSLELAGGRILDLTPDVIGYLLMYFGLRKIGYYSHKFSLANRFCLFSMVASAAVFGVNLISGWAGMSMTVILLGIAEMFLQVALLVYLASGLKEMELDYDITLYSKWLKIIALCIAPGIVLGYAGLAVPALETVGNLMVDIACFAFLVVFYFTWDNFKVWDADQLDMDEE